MLVKNQYAERLQSMIWNVQFSKKKIMKYAKKQEDVIHYAGEKSGHPKAFKRTQMLDLAKIFNQLL